MGPRRVLTGVFLVLVVAFSAGCGDFSCWVDLTAPSSPSGEGVQAAHTSTTRGTTTTTTPALTATTIRPAPTTTTALSALDVYKADMRVWRDTYGDDMEAGYNVLGAMRNPLSPSDEEVAAARALADTMDGLVADLERIQAPADLASAHADYAAALEDMHAGVDRLANALEDGGLMGTINVTRAFAAIYSANEDMQEPQAILEQALGFSIT
jgi:hypothetical protein